MSLSDKSIIQLLYDKRIIAQGVVEGELQKACCHCGRPMPVVVQLRQNLIATENLGIAPSARLEVIVQ